MSIWRAVGLAVIASVVLVGKGAGQSEPPPRVTNGDAETGNTSGWISSGIGVRGYGSGGDVPADGVGRDNDHLFAGPSGTSMTQTVSVADIAAVIDAGNGHYDVSALLGGAAPGTVTTELTAQPLNGQGGPTGDAIVLGPPTSADLNAHSRMISCYFGGPLPPGARSVAITLAARGSGVQGALALVDSVFATTDPVLSAGEGQVKAQGRHCWLGPDSAETPTPVATPTVTPTSTGTVTPSPTATVTAGPSVLPAATHISLQPRRLAMKVPGPGRLRVSIRGLSGPRPRPRRSADVRVKQATDVVIRFTRLRAGRYRVRIQTDSPGLRSVTRYRRLR